MDLATFIGWRVYHAQCARCHASDALGSDFAPELAPRIRRMTWASFVDMLERGYAGLEGVMPAWGEDPDVARYERELWTYLNARAAGALPPGPLSRLPGAR